jgi:hypothetical protein
MTALDVLISLCLVAVLAGVSVFATKFLEDAKFLTVNKYFAMIATLIIWWLCGAYSWQFVIMQWMKAGVIYTETNYWSFAAMTLIYCLVFSLAMPRRKRVNPYF